MFDVLKARVNHGLTQRELAAECGVSLTVIQRLEAGGVVNPGSAKKVADFFKVAASELVDIEQMRKAA